MTSLFAPIRRLFDPIKPIPQGIYHYQSPLEDPRNYRLHLRIEEDGSGIMIVNASTVLHLNQTAAEYAYYFVKNTPAEKVTQLVSQRYSVDPAQAAKDYHNLTERILTRSMPALWMAPASSSVIGSPIPTSCSPVIGS